MHSQQAVLRIEQLLETNTTDMSDATRETIEQMKQHVVLAANAGVTIQALKDSVTSAVNEALKAKESRIIVP